MLCYIVHNLGVVKSKQMFNEVILIVLLIHFILFPKSMSLFNLIFVGTKSFGVLFLSKKNNKFYTIMDFFLEVEHVKNIFELWILIFFFFFLKHN
jgi:hypothetical protein